jgi:hypothetical protein
MGHRKVVEEAFEALRQFIAIHVAGHVPGQPERIGRPAHLPSHVAQAAA